MCVSATEEESSSPGGETEEESSSPGGETEEEESSSPGGETEEESSSPGGETEEEETFSPRGETKGDSFPPRGVMGALSSGSIASCVVGLTMVPSGLSTQDWWGVPRHEERCTRATVIYRGGGGVVGVGESV